MEDKVKDLIGNSLDELDLFVDSVSLEKEDTLSFLHGFFGIPDFHYWKGETDQ